MSPLFRRRQRDPALLTWVRLVRVVKKARRHVAGPIEAAGLSGGQFDVLVEAGVHDGTSQQDCADRLGVTKGNVSQHVHRLEARGLLRRDADGRANALHLTPEGLAVMDRVLQDHDAGVHTVLGALTDDELRQLSALLRKIDQALD